MTLHDVLAAGEADTPAGFDLAAVRHRAGRIRRRRRIGVAAGMTAALAVAAAVAVPAALRTDPAPVATPGAPTAPCPQQYPVDPPATGPGLDQALVPMTPSAAAVCAYDTSRRLRSVAVLTAAEAAGVVARLDAPAIAAASASCGRPAGGPAPAVLQVAGAGGRSVTLRLNCVVVDNGVIAKKVDPGFVAELTGRADRAAACDAEGPDRTAGPPAGATLLSPGTRRLVLCAYRGGKQTGAAALLDADAVTTVGRIDAAPAAPPCPAAGNGRTILLLAVTPTGVERAVADVDDCGVITAGGRTVDGLGLVPDLYDRATR